MIRTSEHLRRYVVLALLCLIAGTSMQTAFAANTITRVDNNGTTITFTTEKGQLVVTPYSDYVFRVYTLPAGTTTLPRQNTVVCSSPKASYKLQETDSAYVISTAAMKAVVNKSTATIAYQDATGTLLSEDAGIDNTAMPRTCSFRGMGDAAFYGGGYNGQQVNVDRRTLTIDNHPKFGWDSNYNGSCYLNIPFIVSTRGYGLLFDDLYRGATIIPSSAGTTYKSGSPSPIGYYFVGGGNMASVLTHYTALTGRQPLPPYWSLGYITSRFGYKSESEARDVISKIHAAGLPLDGIVFDLFWEGEDITKMGNLDWYKPCFPNATAMMNDFRKEGIHTICITEPYFTSLTDNYTVLQQKGYLADDDVSHMAWLGVPKVGLIDATNPDAMDWFWQWYKARTKEGVDGWWFDLGEPESHDSDSYHKGGTAAEVHNEFGNLWSATVYNGLRKDFPEVRPLILPRSGTAGMQRYGVMPWTGDISRSWEGLQAQVPALLCSGMSGVAYMGSDVGGFTSDTINVDLYLRWIEMSTFTAMLRTHSGRLPEPYNDVYKDILPDVRRYIRMHYDYLPYTYTLSYENSTQGVPMARPLSFYGDMSVASVSDEYLWGRDILVAPVMKDTTARSIVFPEGTWVDMNAPATSFAGGSTVSYTAPLSVLPHFARQGALIPTLSQDTITATKDIDDSRLTLTWYLGTDGKETATQTTIYNDDKTSPTALADNAYTLTTINAKSTAKEKTISFSTQGSYVGMPQERVFTIAIPVFGTKRPHRISKESANATEVLHASPLNSKAEGYCLQGDTLYIWFTLSNADTHLHIKL